MTVNKEDIIEDLNKIKDIVILADTEGGKQLVSLLVEDIVSNIDGLLNERHTASHTQLISMICDLKARLDMVRIITRAEHNEKFLKELLEETLAQ